MPTEELFRDDATLAECRAQVVALTHDVADDLWRVALDRTVFYPQGGG
jgi:misacylated tRNA(Ala) deacylase